MADLAPRFMPKLTVAERPGIGFTVGKLAAQFNAAMDRLARLPNAQAEELDILMDKLLHRIEELTPVDRSPSADDIVAREEWKKELLIDFSAMTAHWFFWNEAGNPKNGFLYPGMGWGEAGNPETLEYGHSGQAPHGMVRVALEEFRDNITRIAREVYARQIRRLGGG